MKIANFLANNEIYYLEHNKLPGVCTVETRNIDYLLVNVGDRVFQLDNTYNTVKEDLTSVMYHSPDYDSEFYLQILELNDATKIFPNSLKTFNNFDVLVDNIKEAILATGTTESSDTFSYTIDTNNNVLELIKITADGDIAYRENGDWTLLSPDEEAPTIFDQKIVDVDPTLLEKAITNYDTNQVEGTDQTLEDVSEYVSVLSK